MTTDSARPPRVALFATCMVETLYPGVGMATADLLERNGVEVLFPEGQTCCGQPAFNAGYRSDARDVAQHFLEVFAPLIEESTVDAIVAPSGSCVAMVKCFYRILFEDKDDAATRHRAAEVGRVTYELTEYLVDVLGIESTDARFSGKLTYHPCCHLLRELGVDVQPRRLLAAIEGAELVELPAADECCGFGGLFSLQNADISTAMGRRKARNLAACRAALVALNDVGCMTHLNGLLQREDHRCRAVHIAELLAGLEGDWTERPGRGG